MEISILVDIFVEKFQIEKPALEYRAKDDSIDFAEHWD